MSSYRVRKARWQKRVKLRKRRDVLFFLEQRVKALEEQKELDRVDSEQIHDLLNQLEIKVDTLTLSYRLKVAYELLEQRSWWRIWWFKLRQIFGVAGNEK